jgi:hypothetical protein
MSLWNGISHTEILPTVNEQSNSAVKCTHDQGEAVISLLRLLDS